MPHRSLADFLDELEQAGQLARIGVEVDPELEIAAITQRVAQTGGPALLFQRVKGHHPPLVTNLLGTPERVCRALGVAAPAELTQRLAGMVRPAQHEDWLERLKGMWALPPTSPPRMVKSAACQQVAKLGRDVDLAEWPALRSWPLDTQRTITAGLVFTRDPETSRRHVDTAPLPILDKNRLGLACHRHQHAERNCQRYRALAEPMPVAVVLGGDPLWALVAAAPLPPDADACVFAALLGGKPAELVKCRTHDLEVPAEADVVMEGYVDPSEPATPGGAWAGGGGHYSLPSPVRQLHVTAVTHRANPIFTAVVPGKPPQESSAAAKALQRLWLPLVRATVPELVDYDLPASGGPHGVALVSIHKTYPHEARKAASALWGLWELMFTKVIVVVDRQVDVHDIDQVLLAIGANVHPGRDVFFHKGPAHPLDHAAPVPLEGHAMGIDATAKLPEEHQGPWPAQLAMSREIIELVDVRWDQYGLGGLRPR